MKKHMQRSRFALRLLALALSSVLLVACLAGCSNEEEYEYEPPTTSATAATGGTNGSPSDGSEPTTAEGLELRLLSDGTYEIVGIGNCTDTEIVIPSEYNGKTVAAIGASAFEGKTALTGVTIPATVTSIGEKAFFGCTALASASFGNTSSWEAGDISIPSSELSDPALAAEYLADTFAEVAWVRDVVWTPWY